MQNSEPKKGSFGTPGYRMLGPDIDILKMGTLSRASGESENNFPPQDMSIIANIHESFIRCQTLF